MQAVGAAGGLRDIVLTSLYVTDINNWEKVGQAHSEYFNRIRPATTLVEVSRLINPEILVELEEMPAVMSLTITVQCLWDALGHI